MYKNLLVLSDGTEIFSGVGTTNAIKSVKLTELVNSGAELALGSACADLLEATLFTPGGALDLTAGEEVTLYKVDDQGNRVKSGVFILEKPTRPTADTMKIYGYSRVIKLDKDLAAWVKGLTGWPYTALTFAQMICEACGLALASESVLNGDFPVYQFSVDEDTLTGRRIMQWIGEVCCRFIRANADGDIVFDWYTDSGVTLGPSGDNYYFSGALQYENYSVAPIEAVQIRLTDSEESALWPEAAEGANSYVITGNPLWTAAVNETTLGYLQAVEAELLGKTYTPGKVSIPARLDIRAGSIVKAVDRNGKEIAMYVMQKTNAGQRDTLECTGSARRDSSTAVNNKTETQKSAELKTYANTAASAAVNNQSMEDMFNRLTNYGELQGFYVQDGKLVINAEFVRIVNLIADAISGGVLSSADGKIIIDLSGGDSGPVFNTGISTNGLTIRGDVSGAAEILSILAKAASGVASPYFDMLVKSAVDGATIARLVETFTEDFSAREGIAFLLKTGDNKHEIRLDITAGTAAVRFYRDGVQIGNLRLGEDTSGNPAIAFDGLSQLNGKTISWKDNGDGTYTLIGS